MKTNSTNPSSIFLGYVVDVVAPMALFFVLNRLGVPPIWSLLLGSAIVLLSMTVNTVRQRRVDRVGILVLVEIAVSIVLLFVWRDPRFLLAKPSLYTAIAGVYLIATSFRGRPLTYDGAFQIGTKGDPVRSAAFARCWERSSHSAEPYGSPASAGGWHAWSMPSCAWSWSIAFLWTALHGSPISRI